MKNKNIINKKIISIAVIFIVIILIAFGIYYINFKIINDNKYYTDKMNNYGLNKLYNNKSADPREVVTKSEAVKMIIGASKNIYKLNTNIENSEFENQIWIREAEKLKILDIDKITKENQNEQVTLLEVIDILAKSKIKILEKKLANFNIAKYRNMEKITPMYKEYINDLVENGILDNNSKKIQIDKKIKKSELNKIIVRYVDNYSIISADNKKIETDVSKYPSNYKEYPYISEGIGKEVYEKSFEKKWDTNALSPIDMYIQFKTSYKNIKSVAEEYMNIILNIDYETISEKNFAELLDPLTVYGKDTYEVEQYVKYVKDNKIKLKGVSEGYLPIVYFDGIDYRIRMKINFEIVSSNTYDNVLFGDENESKITYQKENEFLIDLPLGFSRSTTTLYVVDEVITSHVK